MNPPNPWYHVCVACNAKWFSQVRSQECPRCGLLVQATERLAVPWRGHRKRTATWGQSGAADGH